MTQEEKAKAYDEAVKRAKAAIDMAADKDLVGGVVRTIFPELAESEDERIRKIIYNCVYECCDTGYLLKDDRNSVVAWLEKQKEQKPNIELIQRSWYMEGYHDREFGKEPKWIIKTGEGGPKHELNPRYGQPLTEQRPTEEQLHNLNEAIKSYRMDGFDKIADSLHSLYNILNTQEQKPVDLSDMMVHKEPYIAPVPTPMVADEQKPTSISCGHENDAEWSEEEFSKTISLVYKAIRKALASLAVYSEDEVLLDSKEETLCYYSQRCAEIIFKLLRPSKL